MTIVDTVTADDNVKHSIMWFVWCARFVSLLCGLLLLSFRMN